MSLDKLTEATISPIYGRDYSSADKAKADFRAGKDFMIHAPMQWMGRYCSISDFAPHAQVTIRYRKMQQLTIVRVQAD